MLTQSFRKTSNILGILWLSGAVIYTMLLVLEYHFYGDADNRDVFFCVLNNE